MSGNNQHSTGSSSGGPSGRATDTSDRSLPVQALAPGVTLYLIRHGETDWNKQARYQGQRDIPLNDHGRSQAQRNGRMLASACPDLKSVRFVASPLSRAIETMQLLRAALTQNDIVSDDGFEIDDRLIELNYGTWEGQLQKNLADVDPEGVAAKAADPFYWRPRGGESYADLQKRICGWLATLTGPTVAVTHGGVSRVARGAVLELPATDIPFLECPQDRILVLSGKSMRWL